MNRLRRYIQQGVAVGLLLLFGTYYANVTLFYHTHIINGTTIVHSHSHTPLHHASGDGGHSTIEITFFAQLSQLLMLVVDCIPNLTCSAPVVCKLGEPTLNILSSLCVAGRYLRAPPYGEY